MTKGRASQSKHRYKIKPGYTDAPALLVTRLMYEGQPRMAAPLLARLCLLRNRAGIDRAGDRHRRNAQPRPEAQIPQYLAPLAALQHRSAPLVRQCCPGPSPRVPVRWHCQGIAPPDFANAIRIRSYRQSAEPAHLCGGAPACHRRRAWHRQPLSLIHI